MKERRGFINGRHKTKADPLSSGCISRDEENQVEERKQEQQ
jgi:hypothetical protein